MGRRMCWIVIIISLILNVVLLQWTVEAYFGQEYKGVFLYSGVSIITIIVTLLSYNDWKKIEYKS